MPTAVHRRERPKAHPSLTRIIFAFDDCYGLSSSTIAGTVGVSDSVGKKVSNAIVPRTPDSLEVGIGKSLVSNAKPTNFVNPESLFHTSDFNLKPEVQQMISYYDDMYLYANVAYINNIIKDYEFKALSSLTKEKVSSLRYSNSFEEIDDSTYQMICALGSFIPIVGVLFDVLSDTRPVYAADLSSVAIEKISSMDNFATITNAIARNSMYNLKYTVYELYDDAGNVKYVGRTRQSIEARQKQHWKADSLKNGLDIRPAEFEGKTLTGLSHSEARGLEHLVFESHGGFNNKNLLNKIKPLDIDNPKVAKKAIGYIEDALNFIKKLK